MKPLFTVHAGEYLVASYIEDKLKKKYNIWVPSRDTGIDLLVTNSKNNKAVSLQVKYSKDYVVTLMDPVFQNKFKAWGWWAPNMDKIRKSPADLWVFVMQSFYQKTIECIVIPPGILWQKLKKIPGNKKRIHFYLWVTNNNKCWETKGLNKAKKNLIAMNSYSNKSRDFTAYLNSWKLLKKKMERK